jgi:hypothetical protein
MPSQRLGTYDPSQVTIVLGAIIVGGYADGTFVNVERNEDSFSLAVGSDGEACRAKTNNRSGRVTFTLGQWSITNQLLSALSNLDEVSPAGDGIVPLLVKDNSGTSLYSAEKAWITKPAAAANSREPENREWVVETNYLVVNVGGN